MLTILRQIVEEVLSKNDINQSLRELVQRTRKALKVDCCSVYLTEPNRQRYRLAATDGLLEESVGKVILRYGEGLVGLVGERKELINLAEAQNHPNFKYIPEIGEEEFKSFLGMPIEHDGVVLGVFIIQQKESRQFDDEEESFIVTLTAQLASFIYAKQLKSNGNISQEPIACSFGFGGVGIAKAWLWQPQMELEQIVYKTTDDCEMQIDLFDQALFQLQCHYDNLSLGFNVKIVNKIKEISNLFTSYQDLIEEGGLRDEVIKIIQEEHLTAVSAIKKVAESYISQQQAGKISSDLDIRDLAQRLISRLTHSNIDEFNFDEPVILLAEEITASLIAEFPKDKLVGIVSLKGSEHSVAAIVAKSLNIPTVMGVDLSLESLDRKLFVVDGKRKELVIEPQAAVLIEYQGEKTDSLEKQKLYDEEKDLPAITEDGIRIDVQLNAGLSLENEGEDLNSCIDNIGLYRTEIEFMMRKSFPTELEESINYESYLKNFSNKRVRMRTLDVGGDKPLPYLSLEEDNPFLGWRGIRISLDRPNLLLKQFRAMIKANRKYENLEIMLPMVSSLEEVKKAKELLDQAHKEICEEYSDIIACPKLGAMIKVPAVLFILEDLAQYCDYFSIGSNDLTQYVLAVERANSKVAKLYDSFQPSIVRILARAFRICDKEINRPISVCGELAGSPLGALMLVSIGYRELSMNYSSIPEIKYILRRVSIKELEEVFAKAIKLSSAKEIKDLYVQYAKSKGLWSLIGERKN